MDLATFYDALSNDSDSKQDNDEVHFKKPEEIMDTLLNSIHSAQKTPIIYLYNLISFLENDPNQYPEITLSKNLKRFDITSIINLTDVCVSTLFQNETKLKGACLDIGAQKSVISFPQAEAYSFITRTKIKSPKSTVVFRSGDGCF